MSIGVEALSAWLGEWVTVELAKGLLNGVATTVNSDEMGRSLKQATIAGFEWKF